MSTAAELPRSADTPPAIARAHVGGEASQTADVATHADATTGTADAITGARMLRADAVRRVVGQPGEEPTAQQVTAQQVTALAAERPYPAGIPDATVARLPVYLRALYTLADRGVGTVASEELATAAGVNSAKLRKDLSYLGSYGIRGVGYDVDYLVYQVSRALGLTQNWPVVIVGAGNLGRALANYGGFVTRGFRIAAVLDSDQAMVGRELGSTVVRHVSELEAVVASDGVAIGVIATPAGAAQAVCDRLVCAGVTSILNFAPVVLNVPEGVDVRKVDLSIELQILAFHAQRRSAERFGQVAGQAAVEA
jgi:redox-sensing transcriptional repressor